MNIAGMNMAELGCLLLLALLSAWILAKGIRWFEKRRVKNEHRNRT